MKPKYSLILAGIGISLCFALLSHRVKHRQIQSTENSPQEKNKNTAPVKIQAESTPIQLIDSQDTKKKPVEFVLGYLEANRKKLGFLPHHGFKDALVYPTPKGSEIVFSVYQGDVPLLGIGVHVELSKNFEIGKVSGNYRPLESADLSVFEDANPTEVLNKTAGRFTNSDSSKLDPIKVLFPMPNLSSNTAFPAYSLSVFEKNRGPAHVILRASDGQVLAIRRSRPEF
jgi:hypothetical protein